jgi:hypothetical protein
MLSRLRHSAIQASGSLQQSSTNREEDEAYILSAADNDQSYDENAPFRKPGKGTMFWLQFAAMYRMQLRLKIIKQPSLSVIPLILTILYSCSVAFTYFQIPLEPATAPTVRWILTLQTVYLTATSNLGVFTTFADDRRNLLPSASGSKVQVQFAASAIWLGRYVAEMQLRILFALLSTVIIYPICGLRPGFGWYLLYALGLVLQAVGNGAFGLNVAALCSNHLIGARTALIFFSFNFLFSGPLYVARQVTWILLWLRYLAISFYVGQILLFSQFSGMTYSGSQTTGNDILNQLNVEPLSISIIGAILLTILFNCTGIFFLWLTSRHGPQRDPNR